MRVILNGEPRDVDATTTTVDALLRALGLPLERVAVERNGDVVLRAERAGTPLLDGDVLEVVTLVGGG